MIWFSRFDPKADDRALRRGHRVHGRADAVRAPAGRARPDARGLRAHAPVHLRLGAAADRDLRRVARAHRPHHPRALRHERDGDADLATRIASRTASAAAARWASRCPACSVRVRDDAGAAVPGRRDRRHRGQGARTSSRATGACRRRPQEEFTADGWFKTGDVGKIDDRGYVTIVGRSKDLIISGGYNVYPAEVEGFINEMPGVAESAVVGVPHPDFGEGVVAVVVPKPGATLDGAAIVAALKAQHRQLQGAQAGVRRRRAAAQHDGQGAEEPAARAAPGLVWRLTPAPAPRRRVRRRMTHAARAAAAASTAAATMRRRARAPRCA